LQLKKLILVVSFIVLASFACGKKGSPTPKGLPVPVAISDLRGEVKDSLLFLSFSVPTRNEDRTEVKDLEGFRILKSCGGCGGGLEPWKEIRLTDREGYTVVNGRLYAYDNDLTEGLEYAYRVFTVTRKGIQGSGSNIFSIRWQRPPAPPKEISAKEGDSRITLMWESEQYKLYNVYRIDEPAYTLFPLNPSPLGNPTFTDTGLRNGQQYRYEVRSVVVHNGVAFEGEGNLVQATPKDMAPPEPPKDLKLEKKGSGVFLSWSPNKENDVEGYNVYKLVAGKGEKVNKKLVEESRFQDEKPGEGRYVSYYVTAVDASDNESGPSREEIIILKE
jgi:hypothetical protein